MIKVLILVMAVTLSYSTSALANEIDYKVMGGKLHILGYVLEPEYELKISSPPEDDDALIVISRSPSGRWLIIKTGNREKTEMWLYDSDNKNKPVKIDFRPRGMHIKSIWHGDDIFEIEHAGMGYLTSDFYKASDLEKTFNVDSLILYDTARDIYVSFYLDGVEVGKGFLKGDMKPERFDIKLDYEYVMDAYFAVEDVSIQGRQVIVKHRKADGSLATETFVSHHLGK